MVWVNLAIGVVYGLVLAAIGLATVATAGVIFVQPGAWSTWLALAVVLIAGAAMGRAVSSEAISRRRQR